MQTTYQASDPAIAELRHHFAERLVTSDDVRRHHGQDMSYFPAMVPDAVVYAESTEEVQQVVAACARHRVPLVPFGAGSSVEGQLQAVHGGISLDLTRMNRIVEVHESDFDAVVQPGVTRSALNAHLRHSGITFPVDPGADATIGGMASTRASGTNAVRYGTMRENVLALEVVLASGEVIRTGCRAKKSSTGYDLTKLFVGAEGTLGVITEVTLRLHPVPAAVSSAVCAFETVAGAIDTCIETIQGGVPIARVEFLDEVAIAASNRYSHMDLAVKPTLFLEFHGTAQGVREQVEIVEAIARQNGGGRFSWALQEEDRSRLWKARHDSAYATRAMRPGATVLATDACVPISRLAENLLAARADLDASALMGKVNGHVGDGNFHVSYLIMPGNEQELAEARRLAHGVVMRAIESGGTASGEHGVGLGKLQYLRSEHGSAVDVMKTLKAALDPLGIMNPGKLGTAG